MSNVKVMEQPLAVLRLYPEHDYTLPDAFNSRYQHDPRRPFARVGILLCALVAGAAFAQPYPAKLVRLVLPYSLTPHRGVR